MSPSELKTTLKLFMTEVWNEGDISNIKKYVAPSYFVKNDVGDPWNEQTLDVDTFIQRLNYTRNAFPDIRFDIQEMVEEENLVAVSWFMSGKHEGDLPGIPATGKNFRLFGMTFYYFEDGKLCGHSQAFDQLGFLSQIGVMEINTGA